MVKDQITITIDREARKKVDELVKMNFLGHSASRSAIIEFFILKCLKEKPEISVERVRG